jgi:TRAP-type C4-dicarboxylate transport system permease small subunit
MILFGSFTLWGGFKFVMLSISNGPVTKPASVRWDITALIAGLFIYAMIFLNHGQLFGVGLSFD